jgi:hypothetical protein
VGPPCRAETKAGLPTACRYCHRRFRKDWIQTAAATQPSFRNDKTILNVEVHAVAISAQIRLRTSSMFELATAFITLFSASIFLAHAVEAYHAQ